MLEINGLKEEKIIDSLNDSIYNLLLLKDGRIACCLGSNNLTIQILNLSTFKSELSLKGHYDVITSVCQIDNGFLISSSIDKCLCVWNIGNMKAPLEEVIFEDHYNGINKVISLSNNRIASCGGDGIIRIYYSNAPYTLIKSINAHKEGVISIIQLKGKEELISTSIDCTLIKWNLDNYQSEAMLSNVYCQTNNSLREIKNNKIVVGGFKKIVIVNLDKYTIEKSIEDEIFRSIYSVLELRNGSIIFGAFKRKLYLYNQTDNKVSSLSTSHGNDISCLININENTFLSCSYDSSIIVWKY